MKPKRSKMVIRPDYPRRPIKIKFDTVVVFGRNVKFCQKRLSGVEDGAYVR